MLMFTMGVVPPREQTALEEAKESKDKKGGESGAPPAPLPSPSSRPSPEGGVDAKSEE